MKKKDKNKKHTKRLRNLVLAFLLTSIFIAVATYAWFIGSTPVAVEGIDISIATVDSLLLSLDGKKWATTVTISKDTVDDVSYSGHTNSWGTGLVPMSTIGDMNVPTSRMVLFEKSALSPTAGGYRLISGKYPNEIDEAPGYVVFDLFIKNFSGRQYIQNLNILDEEAIYLNIDSAVVISTSGVADTGIENSVRVGFAQVGRIHGDTTDQSKITSLTCTNNVLNSTTGICRRAAIWEPNENYHVDGAIQWYQTSCKRRVGFNISLNASYDANPCATLVDGAYYPTYAVGSEVTAADNVDIYDGIFNTYGVNPKLYEISTMTDAKKLLTGVDRREIFTLAPNSITKVRIYIWLEGQDIDNYEYAAIGKAVTINFGFTKQRFTEADFGYTGPTLGPKPCAGCEPVITLVGPTTITIPRYGTYSEPGYSAYDTVDGDLTYKVQVTNPVDTSNPGTYYIQYMVSDWWGNYAEVLYRSIIVTP